MSWYHINIVGTTKKYSIIGDPPIYNSTEVLYRSIYILYMKILTNVCKRLQNFFLFKETQYSFLR